MGLAGHIQFRIFFFRNNRKRPEPDGLYEIHKNITSRKSGYVSPKNALICRTPSLRLEDWVRRRQQERRKLRRRMLLISVFLLPVLCIACYFSFRSLIPG